MEKTKIFIDAGHGGTESGAVNSKVREKDINLTVAKHLRNLLLTRCGNVEVKLSRESDIPVRLEARPKMAKDFGADVFISVHHNACGNGNGDGFEVIYDMDNPKSKVFADTIAEMFSKTGQNKRSVYSKGSSKNPKIDYYSVLRNLDKSIMGVITEYAFLDTKDYEAIDTEEDLKVEANAIYEACVRMFKLEPLPKPSNGLSMISVNGKLFSGMTIDGKTYVALRPLCESLGHKVDWDKDTKSITVK